MGTLVLLEIAGENAERYQTPGPIAVNVSSLISGKAEQV